MNAEITESQVVNNVYTIDDLGWGNCSICRNQIKGLNAEATHRLMTDHMLCAHGIIVTDPNASDAPAASDVMRGVPMYIPPRRNGTSVMRSLRTDYGDGPDAPAPATLKRLSKES